jgi:Domain of unknown function (DUF4349)
MRQRDRRGAERPDPRIERELAAVDAGLAGLDVSDDLAGIAEMSALATEERPSIDAEFAAHLDERAAAGFPRSAGAVPRGAGVLERLRAIPPRGLIAPAAAAATLLVVVGVAITAIGGFSGGSGSSSSSGPAAEPASRAGNGGTGAPVLAKPRPSGGQVLGAPNSRASTPRLGALEDSGVRRPVPSHQPRRVSRSANLTLSTDPDRVRAVADGVTQVTRRWNGLVISSQITSGKGSPNPQPGPVPAPDVIPVNPSLGADFKLRIPASKLEPALDDLSSLGLVVSRSEGSQDITGRFNSARQRIGDLLSERDALIKHLAGATTAAAVHALKHRLAVIRHQLGRAEGRLDQLRERVSMVPVQVSVVARGEAASGGGFGIGSALHDAGRILTVAAGILLIGLAVLGPLAVLAALAWLTARALTRWRRERALGEHGI